MTVEEGGAATELPPSQCWALLREAVVGRLAVVRDGAPEIFPVNYVVDHGSIVFRTADGTKFRAAVGHLVAFEADGFDPSSGKAWSVVVKGRGHEVAGMYDVLDAMQLPVQPWHPAPKPRFVRIDAEVVTGRRFPVSARATPIPADDASDPSPGGSE